MTFRSPEPHAAWLPPITFITSMRHTWLAVFTALSLLPGLAHAQAIGGGGSGSGWMQGALDLFTNNLMAGIGIAAILFIGALFLAGRVGLLLVVGVIAGIIVMSRASQIYTLIAGAAGG